MMETREDGIGRRAGEGRGEGGVMVKGKKIQLCKIREVLKTNYTT